MRKAMLLTVAAAGAAVCLLWALGGGAEAPNYPAADGGGNWPGFRGPARDGVAPGVKLPGKWPDALRIVWKAPLGEGFSSPAVIGGPRGGLDGGRVFVLAQDGEEEAALCLDAASGKQLWRQGWRARFRSSYGGGPRATPAVDGDRVLFVGGTGEMACLATADGKVLWRRSFSRDFNFRTPIYGLSPSPLIDGGRVFVHVGGKRGHSVVALDRADGKLIWHSQDDPPGYASPMIVPASPTRRLRQLVVFTELGLISLDPDDGDLYWRFDWTTSYEQNVAQPMLDGDRLVITTLTGCACLTLTQSEGRPAWRLAWRNDEMAAHFSCAITRGGFLYGVHGRRCELRCIDLADGSVRWSQRLDAEQRAGMLQADDCLIVYTDRGGLLVVEATSAGYRERARLAGAGRNWVPPVLAAGCLFLRDEDSLRCLALPAPAEPDQPSPGDGPSGQASGETRSE